MVVCLLLLSYYNQMHKISTIAISNKEQFVPIQIIPFLLCSSGTSSLSNLTILIIYDKKILELLIIYIEFDFAAYFNY